MLCMALFHALMQTQPVNRLSVPPYRILMGGYGPPTTSFSLAMQQIGDRLQAKFGKEVDVKYGLQHY